MILAFKKLIGHEFTQMITKLRLESTRENCFSFSIVALCWVGIGKGQVMYGDKPNFPKLT